MTVNEEETKMQRNTIHQILYPFLTNLHLSILTVAPGNQWKRGEWRVGTNSSNSIHNTPLAPIGLKRKHQGGVELVQSEQENVSQQYSGVLTFQLLCVSNLKNRGLSLINSVFVDYFIYLPPSHRIINELLSNQINVKYTTAKHEFLSSSIILHLREIYVTIFFCYAFVFSKIQKNLLS